VSGKAIPSTRSGEHVPAETFEIMEAAKHLLERGLRNANVTFFSDSQSAIKALNSVRQNSTLTTNYKRALNAVGLNNTVSLIWIPGNRNPAGNEKADELARIGSEMKTATEEVRPPHIGPAIRFFHEN